MSAQNVVPAESVVAVRAGRSGRYVPRAARGVSEQWRRLAVGATGVERFHPAAIRDQPEVVRRWLGRALAVGVPLGGAVRLRMHGQIRLGEQWRPFEADQILAPPHGYIWAATAHLHGLPVTGFDRLSGGTGEMRWKLMGLLPVVTATGPDLAMSAAGRLAAEIVLAPAAFSCAQWSATGDPEVARGSFPFAHGTESIDLRVAADGQVRSVSMQRWGKPDASASAFGRHAFGADLSNSETFAGLTIPTAMSVGWGWGTDGWESGEFFRARITDALLLEK